MTLFPKRDYGTRSQVRLEISIIISSRRWTWAQSPSSSRTAASSYFWMALRIIWMTSSDRGLGTISFSPGEWMVFLTMPGVSVSNAALPLLLSTVPVESVECPAGIPHPAPTSGVTMDAGSSGMEGKTLLLRLLSASLVPDTLDRPRAWCTQSPHLTAPLASRTGGIWTLTSGGGTTARSRSHALPNNQATIFVKIKN